MTASEGCALVKALKAVVEEPKIKDIENLPDETLLRLATVIKLTGHKSPSIFRDMPLNAFPMPYRVGVIAVRWKLGEIREWLASKVVAR